MKKFAIAPATLLILLLTTLCCNKGGKSTPSCALVTITIKNGVDSTIYNLLYNSGGQITAIDVTGPSPYSTLYSYFGNRALLTTTGSQTGSDTIIFNADGLMASSSGTDASGNVTTTDYTYNNSGQIQESTTQENGGLAFVTSYQYTNGDCTSTVNGETTNTYTYNSNEPEKPGDVLMVRQLLNYGGQFIQNAHLVSSAELGSINEVYTYTYDNTGKITTATITTNANSETLYYQYSCN